MRVVDISNFMVGPSTGSRHQPAWVPFFGLVGEADGIVLAPALVEHDPHDDAGIAVQRIHYRPLFLFPLRAAFGRDVAVELAAADKVLPHHQAEAVRVIVPAPGMGLDVDPDKVASNLLQVLQVVDHGRVGRRGQRRLRPVTLVQRAKLEDGLAVQVDLLDTGRALANVYPPHANIGIHRVNQVVAVKQLDIEVVKIGFFRAPAKDPVLEFQRQVALVRAIVIRHHAVALLDLHLQAQTRQAVAQQSQLQVNFFLKEPGCDLQCP